MKLFMLLCVLVTLENIQRNTCCICIFLLPHIALSFWFQREDFRKQYQEENPEVKSMREVVEN